MKTNEFVEQVEQLGYFVKVYSDYITIKGGKDDWFPILLTVDRKSLLGIDTSWTGFDELSDKCKRELAELALIYIKTPLDERKEVNKYHIRATMSFSKLLGTSSSNSYLNLSGDVISFSDNEEMDGYKTIFTDKDIENFPCDLQVMLDTVLLVKEAI